MPWIERISHDSEGRANKGGCQRIRLTASSCWLWLLPRRDHLSRVMSACCPFWPSHLSTEAGLRPVTPQLLVSASTPPALSVSELRKRLSCKQPSNGQTTRQNNRVR